MNTHLPLYIALSTCVVLSAACSHTPKQPSLDASNTTLTESEERNKKTVLAFYQAAINDKDFQTASSYVGDVYIQHNPMAKTGLEGLKEFVAFASQNMGDFKVEFKRVFADGDYVIVHGHMTTGPNDRGSAVMDIFRLKDGKVVEHWDVVQPIPETSMNSNTMF